MLQLHMAHPFAATFQESSGILEKRAVEEADVHVVLEYIHIREGCVADTRDRTAVVQCLSDIIAALSYFHEPLFCDRTQLAFISVQPVSNS